MKVNSNCEPISISHFREKILDHRKKSLVEFYARWSGGSQMIAPLLENLAEVYQGRMEFYCIDTDVEKELSHQYGIQTIPTLLFFNQGQIVDKIVGLVPRAEIVDMVKKLLRNY